MKRFDYIVINLPNLKEDGSTNAAAEIKALDTLGALGYELVSVVKGTAYFKRAYTEGAIMPSPPVL